MERYGGGCNTNGKQSRRRRDEGEERKEEEETQHSYRFVRRSQSCGWMLMKCMADGVYAGDNMGRYAE